MRLHIPRVLALAIIRRATRTPYSHINGPDGSLYMGRFWLRPYNEGETRTAIRVHLIARADTDRHLHDHRWGFWSLVLTGGYIEERPVSEEPTWIGDTEATYTVRRRAGDLAFRRAGERHRIVAVEPGTWTLFITGPKAINDWGFMTPEGKIPHLEYFRLHGLEQA